MSQQSTNASIWGDLDLSKAYKRMQKTCLKKCLTDVSKPLLDPAEESCLHRCSVKYREALQFGIDMLKYQEKQINDANDISKRPPAPQAPSFFTSK